MAFTYPSALPSPLISANTQAGGGTFLQTEFDYGIRHRRKIGGIYTVSASFVFESDADMQTFATYYYDTLNGGVEQISASWNIEGDTSSKLFRFGNPDSPYTANPMGAGKWAVSCQFIMDTTMDSIATP